MAKRKHVYIFGDGKAEGNATMKNLLGGKGANLAEMNLIGVPVPPGFTITTEVCTLYNEKGKDAVVAAIKKEVEDAELQITNTQDSISSLKSNLKRYKGDYASMMRHAYRHRNANKRLLFILSASGFNDAMRRWQYFVRYDFQRKKQITLVGNRLENAQKSQSIFQATVLQKSVIGHNQFLYPAADFYPMMAVAAVLTAVVAAIVASALRFVQIA